MGPFGKFVGEKAPPTSTTPDTLDIPEVAVDMAHLVLLKQRLINDVAHNADRDESECGPYGVFTFHE